MANLRDIRRRIASVRNTQKITRAMKMVAAAKLRRAQESILGARPYAYHLRGLADKVVARADVTSHPLLRAPSGGKVILVVITSERGLCGGFNTNIVNATMRAIRDQFARRELEVIVVGRKGGDLLRRRGVPVRGRRSAVMDGSVMRAVHGLTDELIAGFTSGEFAEVHCVYNEFKSALVQRVVVERLLPFERPETRNGGETDYLYEPGAESVLGDLLVHSQYIQMHRILHESAASEHGARMTAMENATKNAGKMIDDLTLQYNRVRQSAITKEMIEIIGGAEAI